MKQWRDGGIALITLLARNGHSIPRSRNTLNERLFGENNHGGFENRLHLLSPSESVKMEEFVKLKIEQMLDEKLKRDGDEKECKNYLEPLSTDF